MEVQRRRGAEVRTRSAEQRRGAEARQGAARRGKARQGAARRGVVRQGAARRGKARRTDDVADAQQRLGRLEEDVVEVGEEHL